MPEQFPELKTITPSQSEPIDDIEVVIAEMEEAILNNENYTLFDRLTIEYTWEKAIRNKQNELSPTTKPII